MGEMGQHHDIKIQNLHVKKYIYGHAVALLQFKHKLIWCYHMLKSKRIKAE